MWLSSLCGSGNSHDFIIILSFLYEISRIIMLFIRDIYCYLNGFSNVKNWKSLMDNFDHESFQQIHEKLLDIFQPYYQCQIASYHPWRIEA